MYIYIYIYIHIHTYIYMYISARGGRGAGWAAWLPGGLGRAGGRAAKTKINFGPSLRHIDYP